NQLRRGSQRSCVLRSKDRRASMERDRARIFDCDQSSRFRAAAPVQSRCKDRDNTEKTPLCIHRAPLGTHERFIGFLIEHYAGNFPLWLAPEQVRILPIGDEAPLLEYARSIQTELRAHQVRCELDSSSDHM